MVDLTEESDEGEVVAVKCETGNGLRIAVRSEIESCQHNNFPHVNGKIDKRTYFGENPRSHDSQHISLPCEPG